MSSVQDFGQLYRDVSENIANAMADISALTVSNAEGQEKLNIIFEELKKIQKNFDEELKFLETNAEWEKFTIAFFGETNAGKSTILESLRILFNEPSRQQLIAQNQENLDALAQNLKEHASRAEEMLRNMFIQYANHIKSISKNSGELKEILESETRERLRIIEESTSFKIKRNLFLSCLGGLLAGAGLASALFVAFTG